MPDSKCAFEEQGCLYKDDCAEGESSAEKPEISNNKKTLTLAKNGKTSSTAKYIKPSDGNRL